jgi:hypothetical protein
MTKLDLLRWTATSILACAAVSACRTTQQEPIVAEPGEPPLPPASGTPVAILIDEAGKLALRADQIDKLHEIDQQLSTRNGHIDSQLRDMDRPSQHGPGGARGGMGGPPGGGMGGGGMGGPPGGRGGEGPRGKGPPPGMARGAHGDPAARSRLLEERAANVKDAITRALAILDPDQSELARKILDDHGANDTSEQPGPPGFGPDGSSGPPR